MRLRWFFMFVLALVGTSRAASIRATLEPAAIQVGESAQLDVVIDGVQNAPAPDIANVGGLQVRYVGPSSQVSIVNGRMTASITHRYIASAPKAGTFAVGPITLEVDGQRLDAGTVSLTVGGGGSAPAARGGSVPADTQLALVLTVPKTDVFLHEQVPLVLSLRVGNVRVADLQYPQITGDGVSIEKLPEPTQRQDGNVQIVEFRTVLTPLKAGSVTVGPANMALSKVVRGRGGDAFFGFFGDSRQPLQLRSEPVALNVSPLPDEGRPADFAGFVGTLTMAVQVAPRDVAAGDPITVTTTLRGTGNLEHLSAPTLSATNGLRLYAPQPSATQSPGSRVFEQVVIPEAAGTITLPPVRVSYFDPEARAYRTLTGGDVPIVVRPSAAGEASPRIVGGAPAEPTKPAETLGRDIVFVKDAPGVLMPIGDRRHRHPWFWLLQLLPGLAWLGITAWDRRRHRFDTDVRFARFSRAGSTARGAIQAARGRVGGGEVVAAHDDIVRSLHAYLAAKLDLPPGGITEPAIREKLTNAADGTVSDIAAFLATEEEARYAPGTVTAARVEEAIAQAERIVKALESDRRLARSVGAAVVMLALSALTAFAAGEGDTPHTAFFQGNAAYGDDRFTEAVAAYDRVLAAGVESPAVHFNLGNAHLRSGDIGRAILAYERARRLAPRDPDVDANLRFARDMAGDKEAPSAWTAILTALANAASTNELWLAASLCWFAFAAVRILAIVVPATARLRGAASAILLIALASTATLAAYRALVIESPAAAVVVARGETSVRFEPTTSATQHFVATPGTLVRIVAEREGWVQIARADGLRGWVEASSVSRL